MLLFIFSLVLTHHIQAQESSQIYLSPCFDNNSIALSALKKIQFIKTQKDKIEIDKECLEILTLKKRKKLYLSYLGQNFQFSLKSSQDINNKVCRIELIKTQYKVSEQLKVKLSKGLNINSELKENKSQTTSSLIIQNNMSQTIAANSRRLIFLENNIEELNISRSLSVKCSIVQKGYNISVDLQGSNHSLVTSRFIKSGQTIDLGSLNTSNNDQASKTGIFRVKNVQSNSKDLTNFKLRVKN